MVKKNSCICLPFHILGVILLGSSYFRSLGAANFHHHPGRWILYGPLPAWLLPGHFPYPGDIPIHRPHSLPPGRRYLRYRPLEENPPVHLAFGTRIPFRNPDFISPDAFFPHDHFQVSWWRSNIAGFPPSCPGSSFPRGFFPRARWLRC